MRSGGRGLIRLRHPTWLNVETSCVSSESKGMIFPHHLISQIKERSKFMEKDCPRILEI